MIKICQDCHKEFETKFDFQKFCCQKCKDHYRHSNFNRNGTLKHPKVIRDYEVEARVKQLCRYRGTGNGDKTCEKCKYGNMGLNANGEIAVYDSGRHICKKHNFCIGQYGTCDDFKSQSTSAKGNYAINLRNIFS